MTKNVNHENRVYFHDPLFVLLLEVLNLEVRGYFKVELTDVLEWHYSRVKSPKFRFSNYNTREGQDPNAYAMTWSFRTKLLKEADGYYSYDFMSLLVQKLEVFGPFEDWNQFGKIMEPVFLAYLKRDWDTMVATARNLGLSTEVYSIYKGIAAMFASFVFEAMIFQGKVSRIYNKYRLFAANKEREILLDNPSTSPYSGQPWLSGFAKIPKPVIHYFKETLFAKNNRLFFVALDSYGDITDAISIIPLNETGYEALKNGSLCFSHIEPRMVCAVHEYRQIRCIYLDIRPNYPKFMVTGIGFISYLPNLLLHAVGPVLTKEIPVFVLNDSKQKDELMRHDLFIKTEFKKVLKVLKRIDQNAPFVWDELNYSFYVIDKHRLKYHSM